MATRQFKEGNGIADVAQTAAPPAWMRRIDTLRRRHISDFMLLVVLSLVTGAVTGAAAMLLKYVITAVSGLFLSHIDSRGVNWWIIGIPVVGITLTGIFTRYLVKTRLSNPSTQVTKALGAKKYRMRHNVCFSPLVASAMTLGLGGSAGDCGPTTCAGSATGSNLGQLFGLPDYYLKILIGCGSGAGIAGVFCAPVSGLMFVLEVLRMKLSLRAVFIVVLACLASYFTTEIFLGFHPDLSFTPHTDFTVAHLPYVALLGFICGLYSLYYFHSLRRMNSFFLTIRNPWIRNISGGLVLGCILLLFPSLFSMGYPVIGTIIADNPAHIARGSVFNLLVPDRYSFLVITAGILILKCWAVATTNGSGGVGGNFAPTLFAGSIMGWLTATLFNMFGGMEIHPGIMAYVGMAGVMAGVIKAPFTAFFIVMEMTQTYKFAFPAAVCSFLSFAVVKAAAIARQNWLARKDTNRKSS